jgi:L-iditol 2-dehydrogenase
MKTCTIGDDGKLDISEQDVPAPGHGELVVKMRACGICGTDVEKLHGNYPSRILGHEAVGEIASIGAGVNGFNVGDRVFPHHHVPCYQCHFCRSGSETMCPHFSQSNISPGGLSEYFRVPEWNVSRGAVFKLPPELSFRAGALIEPLACVVRGLKKVSLGPDSYVTVIGVGPVGMLHISALRILGAGHISAVDISEERMKFARKLGAHYSFSPGEAVNGTQDCSGGTGSDITIVAAGSASAIDTGIATLRKGGKLIQFGLPKPGTLLKSDFSNLFKREISIITTYSAIESDVAEAIGMITSHSEELESIISHTFRLEKAHEAFRLAEDVSAARKIIVEAG